MRKTKENKFFKKFLNLKYKLVENTRLINDKVRNFFKNQKILNILIDPLIESGLDP